MNESETQATTSQTQIESSVENSFFYTSDKKISAIDDQEILEVLISNCKNFSLKNSDSEQKRALLEILENEKLMTYVLTRFNLNIFDFFKLLYSNYNSLFKGAYIKKLKNEIQRHDYKTINLSSSTKMRCRRQSGGSIL